MSWRAKAQKDTGVALGPEVSQDSVLVMRARLGPSEQRRWRFIAASHPVEQRTLKGAMRLSHADWKRQAADKWRRHFAIASRPAVGDPMLETAVEQAAFVLLGSTEDYPQGSLPIGNPFQYRDTWIRDAARQVAALSQWGFSDEACELATALVDFELHGGGFMSQRGQLDGTGQVLWGLDQAFSRTSGTSAPDSIVRAVLRAWRWCERERDIVGKLAPPFRGLMPPADPRDNELRRGYLVGTDGWTLAGYRSAEAIIRGAGFPREAETISRSLREYEGVIRARLAAINASDVPAAWRGPARDWGNISIAYPCGVLEPQDPKVRGLARRIWTARGRVGLVAHGAGDSLHGYVGADLASWALLVNQPAIWDSILTEMMEWRTGTGGAPEIFSLSSRDFGTNFPPHVTAAAALLTTVRNGLVFDDRGDTLRLTLGTRRAWWSEAAHLKDAPTRWGRIDLSFALEGSQARWRWTPVPVWTILRVPPGMHVRSTSVVHLRDDHTVLVPPRTAMASVQCVSD